MGDIDRPNFIQGNEDDGIAITADILRTIETLDPFGNPTILDITVTGFGPTPTAEIRGNVIGGSMDGTPAGNLGDGVSVRTFGHTAEGTAPADVDFDLNGDGFITTNGGAADLFFTNGPNPNILLDRNTISQNGRTGVNVRLQGGGGFLNPRSDNFAKPADEFSRITLTGNTIASNGEHGVFLRADSDMNQNRFTYLPNFPDPPVAMNDNLNYSPFRTDFTTGPFGWDDDYRVPYLNLATVQNTTFTVTDNIIQNNGTGTVIGHGLEVRVGTGAYVAADVRDNDFGGNLEEDLFTAAFFSNIDASSGSAVRVNTFDSQDNSGDLTFDFVYLDDAALLDMRFTGNSGDQINPLEDTPFSDLLITNPTVAQDLQAWYTNDDDLKRLGFFGPIAVLQREAGVFKIDDAFGLNAPVNSFIQFGSTQDVEDAFATANGSVFVNFDILNISAEAIWPETPFQDAD